MKIRESKIVENLLKKLIKSRLHEFPKKGYTEVVGVPQEQGVYIIYNNQGAVAHVGRTQRGKKGLRQRLGNHLKGQSSFVKNFFDGKSSQLHGRYKFKYLVIKNSRERALVEALAIGKLCPKYLGLGNKPL